MILQVSPESSWLVRAAAALVLNLHIGAAGVGLLSGAAALLVRKGARLHRLAGNVFFVSMLVMAGVGACVAPFLPQRGSVLGGTFTFYLVATGWMTVRRKAGGSGRFEIGALLFAVGIAVAGVALGLLAARSPGGKLDGIPAPPHFVFAGLAALAATLDLRLVLVGGIAGAARIARHLWRMCLALLIAAFSFFLGQPLVFPAWLRGSAILFVPEIWVLGMLLYWLVRVRFKDWSQHAVAGREPQAPRTSIADGAQAPHP